MAKNKKSLIAFRLTKDKERQLEQLKEPGESTSQTARRMLLTALDEHRQEKKMYLFINYDANHSHDRIKGYLGGLGAVDTIHGNKLPQSTMAIPLDDDFDRVGELIDPLRGALEELSAVSVSFNLSREEDIYGWNAPKRASPLGEASDKFILDMVRRMNRIG